MSEEYGYKRDVEDLPDPRGSDADGPIGFDRLFSLLSNEYRRYALYCTIDRSEARVATETLVDDVVALDQQVSGTEPRRRDVAISLRHTHLPKLSEAAVVDYDPDQSVLVYRGGPRIERWIRAVKDSELSRASE